MATGFPDWTRAIVLLGWDGTNFIPVLLDDLGNLNIYMQGEVSAGVYKVVKVDASGQIVMVPRGQSGNYLDVDALGYLTTVIKGDYAGNLVTVACDDVGRLSAFIIDSVDAWGNMLSIGNAELAARLGSANRYEQQGQVQVIESFESGLGRWLPYPGGADAGIDLDPTRYLTGGYSVKLTTCAASPWNTMIQHQEGALDSPRYGLEVSFALGSEIDRLSIYLQVYDGTHIHQAGWRYHHNDLKMYARTTGAAWTEVATVKGRSLDSAVFSRIKVVMDTTAGTYLRGFLDNVEYDLSAIPLYIQTVANLPRIVVNIWLNGDDGENQVAYIDDVIVTSSEPT